MRALILCPACGSDRLIPLNFSPPRRRDRYLGQPESEPLPVIKCIGCGARNCVSIKVHRALSSD
jgi:hypothetical protein